MRPAFPFSAKQTRRSLILALLAAAVAWSGAAATEPGIARTPRPEGAEVYFLSPSNAAQVTSPVRVRFGLRGMGVAPAGVEKAATGHHHLLVDVTLTRFDLPIPNDDNHRHFGLGQTETVIDLPPGEHTLQLVLGDHNHVPHDPPVLSERITIVVVE